MFQTSDDRGHDYTVIVKETNRRAQEVIKDWLDKNPGKKNTWKDTDSDELRAFIGLLVLAGVYRSKNESINEMWSLADGRAIFPATMTKNRFWSLLRFCRFDDAATRVARSKDDKLAPIRELWSMLLVRLQECYSPGGSLTVDEQLVSTRGRCSFRQYMPSKPGKYGLRDFLVLRLKYWISLEGRGLSWTSVRRGGSSACKQQSHQ